MASCTTVAAGQRRAESALSSANGPSFHATPPSDRDAFDEYVSDPAKPVPYIENVDIGMTREYMTDDQRFASRRPDVLVYQTDPLTDDVTVAGPLQAELYVSTTGTDADFVVKLIDVYPDDAPDLEPNPTELPDGRLSDARARRAVPRPVPQQLREARTDEAGPGDEGRRSSCRT